MPSEAKQYRVKAEECAQRAEKAADPEVMVKVVEIDKTISSGTVLGEIGVFARDQMRMATVVCVTDCEVCELTERKAKELYFQDPSFGYTVLQIIITRLMEDMSVVQSARESACAIDGCESS
jgi:CRP-like cAMP-binding protein